MPKPLNEAAPLHRDGTSRGARTSAALQPDSVGIDERGIADMLAFARQLAGRIVYYDDGNMPAGDWADFFDGIGTGDGGIPVADVAAFVRDPTAFAGERHAALRRPHVMLLLAFLHLAQTGRDALNGITGRHLDYYFRDVLRMVARPAAADRAFVLFEPAKGAAFAEVPPGTRLAAGRDVAGRERIYRTLRPLIVSRAEVASVRSVFAEKRIIGIAEARTGLTGTQEERFLNMLRLPLGDPEPGDPLPPYGDGSVVDFPRLQALAALVGFAEGTLFVHLFELRKLIAMKRRRDGADGEWRQINTILQAAGRRKRNDGGWALAPADPRDFNANLAKALDGMPNFAGLPEIETVDDLYTQRHRADARAAIGSILFLSERDFVRMMDLKRGVDADWKIINGLLEEAGRRKRNDATYVLPAGNPADFTGNFAAALGPVDFAAVGVGNLDAYADAVVAVERYAFMPGESFARVMATAMKAEAATTAKEWAAVYATLADAYTQKVYFKRRNALASARKAAGSAAEGLRAMLAIALGETGAAPTATLLEQLGDFVAAAAELAKVRTIAEDIAANRPIAAARWEEAEDILERAQRQRERLPRPVAQREEWINLYAYEDATTVQVRPAEAGEGHPRWKLFGRPAPAPQPDAPPAEIIGFAIASPLLTLTAGTRQITLTLGMLKAGTKTPLIDAAAPPPFSVRISTAKGWIEPQSVTFADADYATLDGITPIPAATPLIGLKITLVFAADADAIAPPPVEDRIAECPWPVLRIMLRPIWDAETQRFEARYAQFRALRVARVHLRAAVGGYVDPPHASGALGLSPLLLENDGGTLDGKKPFEPFGGAPAVGARLAIGHPDFVNKRLRTVRFRLDWMGGPGNLATHYAAYGAQVGASFAVKVNIVDSGVRVTEIRASAPLFNGTDATKSHTIAISPIADTDRPYAPPATEPPAAQVRAARRFLEWELSPNDFKHSTYPSLATQKSLELAAAIANLAAKKREEEIKASDYAVQPPYTPKLKSLSVDFIAGHEVVMERYQRGAETDQIFHIHPFGYTEAHPTVPGQGHPLLPAYDNEGELYIAIAGAKPPQTLSLLFQLAEGSADPDVAGRQVEWSYLDADGWRAFGDGGIVEEQTQGLINSGIITFKLPATLPAAPPDPRLPAGLLWLRAAMALGTRGVCDAVALHPHAALAEFVDAGNAPEHYRSPLPAGSIKSLADPLPAIARVRQPYTSFGGKVAEDRPSFYTRVSERLRHKRRAVTLWDYERLVLEEFPEIYKVKCLPARLADDADGGGQVRLIIIPDIRHKRPADPFEPKAPAALLARVAAFVKPLLSPAVRLVVSNASYVQVRIRVGVRFRTAGNEGFDRQRLNDELNRYLSPWAFDEGADIAIGRRIYANSLVTFIDERPYVDFVAGIKLFASDDGVNFVLAKTDAEDGDYVSSDRPDAVLVAARQHEIDIIAEDIFKQEEFSGIGYMKIELDFVVS
ncbi:MAG: baseplate J/gp47 family protein [Rhodospirillales bacterium]|nr:baseplate J/gp47 family protein [Rhodospirillales bacterium]